MPDDKAVWRCIVRARFVLTSVLLCLLSGVALSGDLLSFSVYDTPSDGGGSITIEWEMLPGAESIRIDSLVIFRSIPESESWARLAAVSVEKGAFEDRRIVDGVSYSYEIVSYASDKTSEWICPYRVESKAQWFDSDRIPVLVGVLLCLLAMAGVAIAHRGGKPFHIRPIRGLEAVDEAVGRATEMGKPVLFTPGWGGDIQRPTTIAALNILGYVASKTASYRCDLLFPTHDPVIMAAAEEVIHEAYIEAGQADLYKADDVFYTTSSQLGYAAAVDGVITRYKPAAIFLLGTFEGEALILAETGNSVGAMQVAGTDSTIQLSFFMVACDYTLIGEELFAASGYLTGDAKVLSSVRAQDYMKILIVALLLTGAVLVTFGIVGFADWIGMT